MCVCVCVRVCVCTYVCIHVHVRIAGGGGGWGIEPTSVQFLTHQLIYKTDPQRIGFKSSPQPGEKYNFVLYFSYLGGGEIRGLVKKISLPRLKNSAIKTYFFGGGQSGVSLKNIQAP